MEDTSRIVEHVCSAAKRGVIETPALKRCILAGGGLDQVWTESSFASPRTCEAQPQAQLQVSLNFNISADLYLNFYINLRCAYADEWSKHVERARYVDRLYGRRVDE